jgi:hypothetical protein
VWENRDRPGYTWRILKDGVCDGCAAEAKIPDFNTRASLERLDRSDQTGPVASAGTIGA